MTIEEISQLVKQYITHLRGCTLNDGSPGEEFCSCNVRGRRQELGEKIWTALSESQAEVERLKIELAEAQQWIDSEPDWKSKYMDFYMALFKLNQRLYARCRKAEMGEKNDK